MNSLKKCGTGLDWLADGIQMVIGAAVFGLLAFFICFLQGCGNGGGGNAPVYNDQGVCVANCSPEECPGCGYFDQDGNCITTNCGNNGQCLNGECPPGPDTAMPGVDDGYVGYDIGAHQPDYVAPPCKVPPPELQEACMPKKDWVMQSICYDEGPGLICYDGFFNGLPCSTDADCQKVPCEEWPPEVCQGLPCMLVGKWDCGETTGPRDYTNAEFYDNGDGYCRIHTQSSGDLYYKPGDDHLQRPPSGPFELKYTFVNGGDQLVDEYEDNDPYTCDKVVEEE